MNDRRQVLRYYTIVGTTQHETPFILGPCMTEEQIVDTAAGAFPSEERPLDVTAAIKMLNREGRVFEAYRARQESLHFVMRALNLGLGDEAVFLTRQRTFEID
jgi:hypothetical protein